MPNNLAVEIIAGNDHVNIWVDANNNGVRDDDDVNIFVTSSGGVYMESHVFKVQLDEHIKEKLKEASLALMHAYPASDHGVEGKISDLALDLVLRATQMEPVAS